jgi:hypothetical protein
MTLRELINKSAYKSVFNVLYRDYYKNRDDEEVSYIDLAYLRVWDELINKDLNLNKDYKIYIREAKGEDGIDVCLHSVKENKTYAIDFTLWSELIDMEVYKEFEIEGTEALAHILWEITFHGFTEKEVSRKRDELKELTRRIDSGEEKLIPFDIEDLKD